MRTEKDGESNGSGATGRAEEKGKEYENYVKEKTPTHSLARNMLGAFLSVRAYLHFGTGYYEYL